MMLYQKFHCWLDVSLDRILHKERKTHFMNTSTRRILSWMGILFFSALISLHANLLDSLNETETRALQNGEPVIILTEIEGATWPKIQIYRKISASPKQVADLFTDYENAPTYIPNMLKAEILGELKEDGTDVKYTVKAPLISKMSYVVRNTFKHAGDTYRVDWHLLSSAMAKSSTGSLEVEPLGNGSLIRYTNLAEPFTKLAAGLKNQAISEAKTTVEALSKEAERRAKN